jgi:hypothetical protein
VLRRFIKFDVFNFVLFRARAPKNTNYDDNPKNKALSMLLFGWRIHVVIVIFI